MTFKEVLSFEERLSLIKTLHNWFLNCEDEDIYFEWINIVPDCPSEEDFEFIADDEELLTECVLYAVKHYRLGNLY